jgi:hypothetical protein
METLDQMKSSALPRAMILAANGKPKLALEFLPYELDFDGQFIDPSLDYAKYYLTSVWAFFSTFLLKLP